MENVELYRAAIKAWGAEAQTKMVFEEIAEFQEAICKCGRGRDTAEHVAEEIADVQIMLEQMAVLYGVENAVADYREIKLTRLASRVEKAEREKQEAEAHCRECRCPSCDLFKTPECIEGADICEKKCDHKQHTRSCPFHPDEREG